MAIYPYELTIVNPGAETGSSAGWTNVSGSSLQARSQSKKSGNWSFEPNITSSTSNNRQDVSLPAEVYADVDADISGPTAGYGLYIFFATPQDGGASNTHRGMPRLTFFNSSGVQIGSSVDGFDLSFYQNVWVNNYVRVAVPVGTRTIRISLLGTRTSGTLFQVYWDNLKLYLCNNKDGSILQYERLGDEELGFAAGLGVDNYRTSKQFFENFAAYAPGAASVVPPVPFREIWKDSDQLYEIIDDPGNPSGRSLQFKSSGAADFVGILWPYTVGSSSVPRSTMNCRDGSIFMQVELLGSDPRVGPVIRVAGAVSGATGPGQRCYHLRRSGNDLILDRRDGSSAVNITPSGDGIGVFTGWTDGSIWNMLLTAEGNSIRGAAWLAGTVFTGYQINAVDSTYPLGFYGLGRITSASAPPDMRLRFISLGMGHSFHPSFGTYLLSPPLDTSFPVVQVTQAVLESLVKVPHGVRVTQAVLESLLLKLPEILVTQCVLEVLIPNIVVLTGGRSIIFGEPVGTLLSTEAVVRRRILLGELEEGGGSLDTSPSRKPKIVFGERGNG